MRRRDLILTIDVGVSNCKGVLFKHDGSIVARAVGGYRSYYPQHGWAEQKPNEWWAAVASSIRSLLGQAEFKKGEVIAIGVTGQMHGVVSLGPGGKALTPYLTLHDRRALQESEQIVGDLGLSHIHSVTGARLTPSAPLAKICWLRNHQHDIYDKTDFFLSCKDYIKYLLTGDISTDPIEAAGTSLFDIHERLWSQPLLEACGIPAHKLPPVRPPWALAGALKEDVAGQLGLTGGIPVVVGAGDDVELLGVGLIQPGMSLEHFGTTGSILTCVDQAISDPSLVIELYPHVDPSLWVLGGSVNNAGGALAWASRILYENDEDHLSGILEAQKQLKPCPDNPLIFLPYLAGERCPIWNPSARGVWLGLSLEHDRDDMLRAVAEGVLFSLRHVMEKIEEMSTPIESLAVADSSWHHSAWLRLRASIYNRELRLVANPEPTSLGAMILAGLGVGVFDSLRGGIRSVVSVQDSLLPDTALVEDYRRLYDLYRETVARCSPLFEVMAGFRS